jgi:hypothetical protein
VLILVFCHPEPAPELASGSKNFGILVLKTCPVGVVLYLLFLLERISWAVPTIPFGKK